MRDEFRLTTSLQTMAGNCHLTRYAIEAGPLESFSNAILFPTEISPMAPAAAQPSKPGVPAPTLP